MSMIVPDILLALAAAGSVPITSARTVAVDGRLLRVGDVVAGGTLSSAARRRPIAMLPASGPVTLSRHALARLIRRTMPGIRLTGDDATTLTLVGRLSPTRRGGRCRALRHDVARSEPVTGDMTDDVACNDQVVTKLAFDRSLAGDVATGDLPAGTYLGRVALRPAVAVRKGATMALVARAGPVRIERQVVAMQNSRGSSIFVRDAEGQVFAAPLAGDVPATNGGKP